MILLRRGRGIGGDVEASDEDEDEDEKEEEEEEVEKRLARSEGDREAGKPTIRWGGRENNDSTAAR